MNKSITGRPNPLLHRLVSKVLPLRTGNDRQAGNQVGVKKPGKLAEGCRHVRVGRCTLQRSNAQQIDSKDSTVAQRWTGQSVRIAQIQLPCLGLAYTSLNTDLPVFYVLYITADVNIVTD